MELIGRVQCGECVLNCTADNYFKLEVAVLEATRRWAFAHDVIANDWDLEEGKLQG